MSSYIKAGAISKPGFAGLLLCAREICRETRRPTCRCAHTLLARARQRRAPKGANQDAEQTLAAAMRVYVTLHRHPEAPAGRIYSLLLPARGSWEEVDVRASSVDGAGFGVFPAKKTKLDWEHLEHPVLMYAAPSHI
eukprot:1017111-Pleurochrysis_carterae.AAC.1